jgi:hypothetical protein
VSSQIQSDPDPTAEFRPYLMVYHPFASCRIEVQSPCSACAGAAAAMAATAARKYGFIRKPLHDDWARIGPNGLFAP